MRTALSNMAWLFADKLLRAGVTFILSIALARVVGPAQFGMLSYAMALVALFSAFSGLGLDGISGRALVADARAAPEVLGTSGALRLGAGLVSIIACTVTAAIGRPDLPDLWMLTFVLSLSIVFQASEVVDYWFRSRVQSRYSVIARNVALVPGAALKLVAVFSLGSVLAFAGAVLVEAVLAAVGLAAVYILTGERFGAWKVRRATAMSLLKDSWPFLVSTVAISVYMRVDQIMLGSMLDDSVVGHYSAAVRIAEISYMVPMIVVSTLTPGIIKARSEGTLGYETRIRRLTQGLVIIGVAISAVLILGADLWVQLLYGEKFDAAVPVLKSIAVTVPFVCLGTAGSVFYLAENLGLGVLRRTMAAVAMNVLLNLYLIPKHGAAGAAWATVCSQAFSGYFADALHGSTRWLFRVKTGSFFLVNLRALLGR